MKKFLAILMAVAIAATCMVTAFAEDTEEIVESGVYETDHKPGDKVEIELDYEDVDPADLRVSKSFSKGADMIKSVEIKDGKLVIELKKTYGAKAVNVKGAITLRKNGGMVDTLEFDFDVAWDAAEIGDGENLEITLDNAAPVYNFAKSNKNANFIFDDVAASFTVRLVDQAAVNMAYDLSPDKEISKANETANLEFLRFFGTPEFDFSGELNYYVADNGKDWFLYELNAEGKLLKTAAKYDKEEGVLTLKTSTLTSYVVSDKELATVAGNAGSSSAGSQSSKPGNPNTGSADFVNIAVALAVVSLAAAGAVAMKKAK